MLIFILLGGWFTIAPNNFINYKENGNYYSAQMLNYNTGGDLPQSMINRMRVFFNEPYEAAIASIDNNHRVMVFIDYNEDGTVDHVGIICDDVNKVIHATASEKYDTTNWPLNHPRSVMYEKFSYRDYWINRFKGIGRK